MNADPIERANAHLAVALASLGGSEPRSDELRRRIVAVMQHLQQRDAISSVHELPAIIADVRRLTRIQPGIVRGVAKLTQDPSALLLPGVADAVRKLDSALSVLNAWLGDAQVPPPRARTAAEYAARWPAYCRTCGGIGGHKSDPSRMPSECPDCYGAGRCGRCAGPVDTGETVCAVCGWTVFNATDAVPGGNFV
jgi:hypothetical protein